MLKVVDASLAVKWFIPEPDSDKAINLLENFRNKSAILTAPDHIVSEIGSALWKRSTLRKEISVLEALESLKDFLALGLQLHPTPRLVEAALELAGQEHHSPYDMLYVVLAAQLGCEFITADRTLFIRLSTKFPFVRWLGSL
ncbi:MAG TPA: type II toxin-antitoxin system VapC family toxin [Candidatus Acidoferrales bacterium]|jgi:predicted nucleic acid-binding protein|nr:type II toxin-antitoxin system VapC family toxin [Candidatus Acidoferrales bacterium]